MNTSLRLRLVIIILAPLLLIAALLASWAFVDAQKRAKDLFDQSLLSSALAVSRDVALSGGDALSLEVNTLLRDTSDGTLYYHVYAPDGVFVTGKRSRSISMAPTTAPLCGRCGFQM
jgi:two-component system sensor histidine kinase TctE